MKAKSLFKNLRAQREEPKYDFRVPKGTNVRHPVLRVPGRKNYRWDPWIERWVIGKLSYES
jgi:hypothetical protein